MAGTHTHGRTHHDTGAHRAMSMELSEAERARLLNPWGEHHGTDEWYPDDSQPLGQDERGITVEMCNAIRAAADDGLQYREIADLFNFISCHVAVHRHATGRCGHGRGDLPPVPARQEPGPPGGRVSPDRCERLRADWRDGRYDTYRAAAEDTGLAVSAVYRHVNANCSHGGE